MVLHRSVGVLSREISINSTGGVYNPRKADHKARTRRKYAKYQGMRIVDHAELRLYVDGYLRNGQSPEAIAGRLREVDTRLPSVSARSIRRYLKSVYGRPVENLRKRQKRRKKGKRQQFCTAPDRIPIHERPLYSEHRSCLGDTEADFIVSGKDGTGRILVIVDRKIRMAFLELIPEPSVRMVHRAFMRIRRRFTAMTSITTDNDILLQKHKELSVLLGVPIYFCDSYASWQKGTVENTNMHIRKNIPKGSDLSQCTTKQLSTIETKLNGRIMNILGYRTPAEVYAQECI